MNKLIVFALGWMSPVLLLAQTNEFQQFDNGLIYSPETMDKLSHIVDSLNLKYKSCDLDQVFYSKSQTVGKIVRMEGGAIRKALKDMENGIGIENFKQRYPKADIVDQALIIRSQYTDYEDQEVVRFSEVELNGDYGLAIVKSKNLEKYQGTLKGKWIIRHYEKTEYSEATLDAFFISEGFKSQVIDDKYAFKIGYADCLIDTTTTKFKEDLEEGWVNLPHDWWSLPKQQQKNLLDQLRSTRVIGFCSQDSRPRQHAVNIAMLSAETTNWGVFLKAHLDIMNDRFERASDGNYAWGARKTYIRELEELQIDVTNLLLGISMRVENPAQNHYYGSIYRVGRALSETQNRAKVEKDLLDMIQDVDLDDYNRVLAYFLYYNYLAYFEDESLKSQKLEQLKKAVTALPKYIAEGITID